MSEPISIQEKVSAFSVCEFFAWIFAGPPVDDYYHGAPITQNMIAFFVIGVLFALAGPLWPWIKPKLPERFADTLVYNATDFRVWIVLLLFYYFCASFSSIGTFSLSRQISDLQRDMNRYVMPRHLTREQSSAISTYLLAHEPQAFAFVVAQNDREADEYRAELEITLMKGSWTMAPSGSITFRDDLPEGLAITFRGMQSTDRKHPDALKLLRRALKKANIEGYQISGGGQPETPALLISIGHRRRDDQGIIPQPIRDNSDDD